jgi:hypothetical protein
MKKGDPLNHEWLDEKGKDKRKCPAHNFWMRTDRYTGIKSCELCLLADDKRRKEYEKTGGSNKPPIKIGKL